MRVFLFLLGVCIAQGSVLVQKDISCTNLVVGKQCAIHYTIFNSGPADVLSVHMDLDPSLEIVALTNVSGLTGFRVPRLAAEQNYFHAIVVVPKSIDNGEKLVEVVNKPAVVHYRDLEGNEEMVYSNIPRPLGGGVLHMSWFQRHHGDKTHVWLMFTALFATPTLMVYTMRQRLASRYPINLKQM